MKLPFFTIGHSNRTLENFLGLLTCSDIGTLADVRKIPRSRTNPQFNEETLPDALAAMGITYHHEAALGGLRGKARTVPEHINNFWRNKSFHHYADYALSADFHEGLKHLLEQGESRHCVVMCSEAVWWRCHRRIVADYLVAHGESVFHIIGPGRVEPARLTPGAAIQSDGTLVYGLEQLK